MVERNNVPDRIFQQEIVRFNQSLRGYAIFSMISYFQRFLINERLMQSVNDSFRWSFDTCLDVSRRCDTHQDSGFETIYILALCR